MKKVYIHKDRFFIEDDDFLTSPDYFCSAISKEVYPAHENYPGRENHWVQLDIGGPTQQCNLSWGFSLDEETDREAALKHFSSLYEGIKNLYEKLQNVCQELDKETENVE